MWAGLSMLLVLCLLPGGGTESEGEGTRCKPPPGWSIGEVEPMKEVMGQVTVVALLQLEVQGLENVTYMVVNHQGERAQRLHTLLRQKLSENITLYKQQPKQDDVWQTLAGEKDDFLIYDRCGRLTYHISLPYSILGTPYVENAIKETYCTRICGDCMFEQGHGSVTVTLLYLIDLRLTSVRQTPGRSALITSYQLVLPWDREATPDRERWEDTHWVW
uniref:Selenoprotein P N-terminal domain-containing protein n=1 Tax=Hucho hucho TaxID=62062 RepID=A0A4W5Q5T7_9TELE